MMRKAQAIQAVMMVVVATVVCNGCALSRDSAPTAGGAPSGASAGATTTDGGAKAALLPSSARKVIRNAELSLEVAAPAATESKVSALVERLGGYVASSERNVVAHEGERSRTSIQLSLRVPADRLEHVLRELKRFGVGDETEKIGSEDVTDEYIDVGARVVNQRHLEQQLVGLLTRAQQVDEALKVHHELSNVRTEIDRLQGRQRFLETESALAKISLSLSPIRPVASISVAEIGVNMRRAAADSLAVAGAVVTFGIRALGIVLPLLLLFGAPALLALWLLRRRQRKLVAVSGS